MKNLLISLFLLASVTAFSQTKSEKDAQMIKDVFSSMYDIPIPKLEGTWKIYSIQVGENTYYADKIELHIKDLYEKTLALNKDKLTEEDSVKIHKRIVDILENGLKLKYKFWSKNYQITDKNGETTEGQVEYNSRLDKITLRNSKNYKKSSYKIASLTDSKLVLISIDEEGKEGKPVTFIK